MEPETKKGRKRKEEKARRQRLLRNSYIAMNTKFLYLGNKKNIH